MKSAIRRGTTRGLALLVVIAIAMAPTATSAASEQIVMFVPGISGSSQLVGHQGWIDVTSFAGSAVAPSTSGGTQPCQIAVQKLVDMASPHLWVATVNAQTFTTPVKIQVLKTGVTTPFVLYDIQLTNAQITSIGDSGSSALPGESLTLKASSVTLTFNTQNANGTITATTTSFTC